LFNAMPLTGSQALVIGGALSAAAAVAHLVCIVVGAPAYRLMGAGERMARGAEAGKLLPTIATLAIAAVLGTWALYALAGAGVIAPLPFMKAALTAISVVYLGRAFGFPLLKAAFPENSQAFWWVSSSICLVIGALHAYGTLARWHEL
jgi:hypothetical protein